MDEPRGTGAPNPDWPIGLFEPLVEKVVAHSDVTQRGGHELLIDWGRTLPYVAAAYAARNTVERTVRQAAAVVTLDACAGLLAQYTLDLERGDLPSSKREAADVLVATVDKGARTIYDLAGASAGPIVPHGQLAERASHLQSLLQSREEEQVLLARGRPSPAPVSATDPHQDAPGSPRSRAGMASSGTESDEGTGSGRGRDADVTVGILVGVGLITFWATLSSAHGGQLPADSVGWLGFMVDWAINAAIWAGIVLGGRAMWRRFRRGSMGST